MKKINENTKVTLTFGQLKKLVKEGREVNTAVSRAFTNALLEDAEQGLLSWESIARAALDYMSEDEVRDLAETEFDYEEEQDEDFEEQDEDL